MSEPAFLVVPEGTRLGQLLPVVCQAGVCSEEEALQILLENNGLPMAGRGERLPGGSQVVCVEPSRVEDCGRLVARMNGEFRRHFGGEPGFGQLVRHSPVTYFQGLKFFEAAESNRFRMGMDLRSVVRAVAYGSGGLSGYATAMTASLDEIARLSRAVSDDVATKIPLTRRGSVPRNRLPALEAHLLRSEQYGRLRSLIGQLPRHLHRRMGDLRIGSAPHPNARFFRSQFLAGGVYHSGVKASETVAGRLSSTLRVYGRLGQATTWVIPAVLGAYEVSQVAPRDRLRIGTQQATGVVLAAGATAVAGTAVTAALTSAVVTGVVVIPGGVVVLAAFVAAAGAGMLMFEGGRMAGDVIYDVLRWAWPEIDDFSGWLLS